MLPSALKCRIDPELGYWLSFGENPSWADMIQRESLGVVRRLLALAGLATLLRVTPARAAVDDEAPGSHASTAPVGSMPSSAVDDGSFRGQIVLADLGAIVLGGILAAQAKQPAFLATYAIGAPLVHLYHRDRSGAAISLALHTIAPVALGYLTYTAGRGGCAKQDELTGWCDFVDLGLGVLAGALMATISDAVFLSGPRPGTPSVATLVPSASVTSAGGLMFGMAGRL